MGFPVHEKGLEVLFIDPHHEQSARKIEVTQKWKWTFSVISVTTDGFLLWTSSWSINIVVKNIGTRLNVDGMMGQNSY